MARTLEKKLAITEAAPRIDVVVARLTELSRSNARGLVAAGGVTLNGAPIDDPGMPVAIGDVVVARFETGRRYREPDKKHVAPTSSFDVARTSTESAPGIVAATRPVT